MSADKEWSEVVEAKRKVEQARTLPERMEAVCEEHAARHAFIEKHWWTLQKLFGYRQAA